MTIKLKDIQLPSREEIITKIQQIDNEIDKTLVIVLYLTGGRISEVVNTMQKKNWDFKTDDTHVLVTMLRLKIKKGIRRKKIVIPKTDELLPYIEVYLNKLNDNDLLFPFTRVQAWRKVKKYFPDLWCHIFRHVRLTELIEKYDFNDHLLQQFAGWSDTRPAKIYVHLKWKDLKRKLV